MNLHKHIVLNGNMLNIVKPNVNLKCKCNHVIIINCISIQQATIVSEILKHKINNRFHPNNLSLIVLLG